MSLATGKNRGRGKNMARRPRGDEKIKMERKRFGYFPQRFTWRGRVYDVHTVERCWTVSRRRLGNRVERLCFRVRCATRDGRGSRSRGAVSDRVFTLYQDLNTNTWYLDKAGSRS